MGPLEGSFNNSDLSMAGIAYGAPNPAYQDANSSTLYVMPTEWMPMSVVEQSIEQYVQMIADIQYLLGDKAMLPTMIWNSYQTHHNSKTALTLLNKVYWRRQQHPDRPVLTDSEMNSNLHNLLLELQKGRFDDPDDAIAALHGVSMFLFDGGQGAWRDFLKLAAHYVKKVLHHPSFTHPRDALLFAVPKDAFIVKTAMWFDVLGCITTEEPPTFIMEIRSMFGPVQHGVYNVQFDTDPQCSMMSPMGCENRVVWALAETCMLARWKHNEDVKCRLSVTELVTKAQEIDNMLYPKAYEPPIEPMSEADAELHLLRYRASEIFRCSTRLYLAAVVNNDHPQVRQIQDRVEESMEVFRNLFQAPSTVDLCKLSRSVIRSTVFGLYLTGSLTQNRQHREHLLEHINRESNGAHQGVGEGVGNCGSIRKMLEHVWKESDADPAKPVPWRRVLKECDILLV
jgi:C6 transcription factor Pro1